MLQSLGLASHEELVQKVVPSSILSVDLQQAKQSKDGFVVKGIVITYYIV